MNLSLINSVTINNSNVFYKELLVKHLKIIYKTLVGDEPDPTTVINNFNNIIIELTNLTIEDIYNLSFVDYFLLLFELRCTSIGNTIFAELTDKENTKIEININKFIEAIKQINLKKILTTDFIENFEVIYKIPSILDCVEINKKENFETSHRYFLKQIKYNNLIIEFNTLDNIACQKILEKIPAKITAAIIKKTYQIMEYFNQINLLTTITALQDRTLAFNFNINNIIFLIKLLFGDQLMSLYDNIFMLCKQSNFTPEYIENCTPGEYFLYIKKLEAQAPKRRSNEIDISNSDQVNSDPFANLPPITSRSEFTP